MNEPMLQAFAELYDIIERLRAPGGCPWDREQTPESLWPYLLEETYEVKDALNEPAHLKEELGDVLLQVVMQAVIARESGSFDFGDVAQSISQKMQHRHPHVFGTTTVASTAEIMTNWERLKEGEKQERTSIIDGVTPSLPALVYAAAIQERPARLEWDKYRGYAQTHAAITAALDGALLALETLEHTSTNHNTPQLITSERTHRETVIGDLLMGIVGLARQLDVRAEDALRTAARQRGEEFRQLEEHARAHARDVHTMQQADWDALVTSM